MEHSLERKGAHVHRAEPELERHIDEAATDEFAELLELGFPVESATGEERERSLIARLRRTRRTRGDKRGDERKRIRTLVEDDRGAVTAEYALIIMAAVAFAGLLIVILRSDEVRQMLLTLVQNALGSAG